MRYLRGAHVSSVHALFNGRFEVFEFTITPEMNVCGKMLKEINMRNKGIIAGITSSKGINTIPSGEYQLQAGDTLVVTSGRESLGFIQHLFS
jgi:Trk K+ transport system NAD-binding subunit